MEGETNKLGKAFSFWFNINDRNVNSNYENALHKVATFNTVDKFWEVYSYIMKPDDLQHNVEYHLFADGIKPMWEDEPNKNGARWIFRIKKGSTNQFWEELVLAYIGGRFADADSWVNGIVVSTRRSEDILAIWLRGPCN
jgi:translation initiation factor 4E